MLTIDGVSLPTDLLDVRLGDVGCGPVTGTATQIVCTLTKGAAAGTYPQVEVLTADGLVPVAGTVTPITVALSTTAVTPAVDLNSVGGDTLTITGTGLPQKAEQVDVSFSDATKCTVIESSDTQLRCRVDGFDETVATTDRQVTVEVNAISPVTDSSQAV